MRGHALFDCGCGVGVRSGSVRVHGKTTGEQHEQFKRDAEDNDIVTVQYKTILLDSVAAATGEVFVGLEKELIKTHDNIEMNGDESHVSAVTLLISSFTNLIKVSVSMINIGRNYYVIIMQWIL